MIEISYQWRFEDYMALVRAMSPRIFWKEIIFHSAVVFNIGLSVYFIWFSGLNPLHFANMAFAFILLFVRYYYAKRNYRKNYDQQMLDKTNVLLNINGDNIDIVSENNKSTLLWSKFLKVTNEEDYIFLWINKVQALNLPKRAFSDEQQIADCLALIAANGITDEWRNLPK